MIPTVAPILSPSLAWTIALTQPRPRCCTTILTLTQQWRLMPSMVNPCGVDAGALSFFQRAARWSASSSKPPSQSASLSAAAG